MITLKGTKQGIIILAESCDSLQQAREEILEKLSAVKDFFDGAAVSVWLQAEGFSDFETYLLCLTVQQLLPEINVHFDGCEEKNESPTVKQEIVCDEKKIVPQDVFYKGTVRSGQALSATGNLIVLGDANPGSELVAGGNIVVMGAARGMLWAGAEGDRKAVISAARLLPSQIRIADMICRKPDDELPPTDFYPEFAEIRSGHIYIERKLQKIV